LAIQWANVIAPGALPEDGAVAMNRLLEAHGLPFRKNCEQKIARGGVDEN
jgi:hypothetical protein